MLARPSAMTRTKPNPATSSSRAANAPCRRNDDKRQAQQEAKVQTREEPEVQETEQEERVQTLPRRKPRQLSQKVRIESAVAEQTAEIAPETVVAEVATRAASR